MDAVFGRHNDQTLACLVGTQRSREIDSEVYWDPVCHQTEYYDNADPHLPEVRIDCVVDSIAA